MHRIRIGVLMYIIQTHFNHVLLSDINWTIYYFPIVKAIKTNTLYL